MIIIIIMSAGFEYGRTESYQQRYTNGTSGSLV